MAVKPHIEQIPTSHHYGRAGYGVLQIVIHTMEAPKRSTTAEWCAHYFQGSVQASAHFMLDDKHIVQGVDLSQGAWACPFFNRSGIQIEHAGYASQSPADWRDGFNTDMLALSAQLSAWLCDTYDIPPRRLTLDEVRRGTVKGLLGHGDATRAGVGGNTHTDPGDNFPWDHYLDLVKGYMSAGPGGSSAPTPPSKPPKKKPPKHKAGKLAVDGSLGEHTISRWQEVMGTTVDGVISDVSQLTEAVQKWLNKHGYRDANGHKLKVDGMGLGSNAAHRYPRVGRTHTIEAIEAWTGTTVDGFFSARDSSAVREIQRKLNNHK